MPKMLKELYQHRELGFLHAEMWFSRTIILVQYWRSLEQLLAYAKNKSAEHLPAWKASAAVPILNQAVDLDAKLYDLKLSPLLADAKVAPARSYLDMGNRQHAASLLAYATAIHAAYKTLGEQYRAPLRLLETHLGAIDRTKSQH